MPGRINHVVSVDTDEDPRSESHGIVPSRAARLLVVNYHFPPTGSAGGLRWAGISKYLVRLGWEVHYLAGAPGIQPGVKDGVELHVCPRLHTINDLYNALAQRVRRRRPTTDGGQDDQKVSGSGVFWQLRRELASLLSLPDGDTRGWLLRAAAYARSLLIRLSPDVVVSSGPPHTAHLVGMLATAGLTIPLMVDMRDPWAMSAPPWDKHAVYGTTIGRFMIRRLESLVFRAARGVIANTPELAAALARRYPETRVSYIPNGIDLERLPPRAVNRFPGLGVAYAGTLYGGRDLDPLLRAFRLFLDQCPGAAAAGSRLRVAGYVDAELAARLRAQIHASGMTAAVDVLGFVPASDALDLLNRSGLSVVLAQEQGLQIPSKIYESMGLQVPTLVIAESESAAAREARRIGAVTKTADDIVGICQVLKQIWSNEFPAVTSGLEVIHHGHLAESMSRLLGEAVEARKTAARPVS
jgi:glycosyltransferase involved in cell wall biosynthesis